jgi:catechol 2,3-dioxygenase-like lactoylglutathione lyase family enzyme
MHRSRLQTVVVDCDDLEEGTRFWSAALGVGIRGRDDTYVLLDPVCGELRFLLQRVPEPKTCKARVHLDIESDDLEAEVRRLEALGAQRQGFVDRWWVMLDPCGNEFCVVPARTEWFEQSAHVWEDGGGQAS